MRIDVVDDEPEVREAVLSILAPLGHTCRTWPTITRLREGLATALAPEVVLVDLDIAGEDVLAELPALVAQHPDARFVALTGHRSDAWLFGALEAGCTGYVLKAEAFGRLAEVIGEVARGGAPLSAEIAQRVLRSFRARTEGRADETRPSGPTLSRREREVLGLLAEGYRYEQVASHLGVSLGSVRTYVLRLYEKLGVSTKSEATAIALRRGLL